MKIIEELQMRVFGEAQDVFSEPLDLGDLALKLHCEERISQEAFFVSNIFDCVHIHLSSFPSQSQLARLV